MMVDARAAAMAATLLWHLTPFVIAYDSFCDQAGWELVFADDFDGDQLNSTTWSLDLNGGDSRVRNSMGTADNVYLEEGALVLRSKREKQGRYNYVSTPHVGWNTTASVCLPLLA